MALLRTLFWLVVLLLGAAFLAPILNPERPKQGRDFPAESTIEEMKNWMTEEECEQVEKAKKMWRRQDPHYQVEPEMD